MDQGVMKQDSTQKTQGFSELEPLNQIQFSVIAKLSLGLVFSTEDADGVF